jgi:hypothetical protein
MLAYLFWHCPRLGVDRDAYEDAQRAFHQALQIDSACFHLATLPFDAGDGYEDWYLVDGWEALGELNATAVDAGRRGSHDQAASLAGKGWGAVYALLRGDPVVPGGTEWLDKPRNETTEQFSASLPHDALWRRQLVLGPAPEFCAATRPSTGRRAVWPRP